MFFKKIRNYFQKACYSITVKGSSVFVNRHKPIINWSSDENDKYLKELGSAIRKTVDVDIWSVISKNNPEEDPSYRKYVERIRTILIKEYGFADQESAVEIGYYHYGKLVLSFPAKEGVEYPMFFRGIQLKPYLK